MAEYRPWSRKVFLISEDEMIKYHKTETFERSYHERFQNTVLSDVSICF